MQNDSEWYDIWDEEDRPVDNQESQALEIARLRGILEKQKEPNVEKFYIVRGGQIYVCHKSQMSMKRYKDENSEQILRDITAKGVRMVMYNEEGLRKVDR